MRKILFWLLVFIGVTMVFRGCNDGGKLLLLRVAALKNDVITLLRCQEKPAEGLMEALIAMFSGGRHPPAVLDYCIQHLGAMQNDIRDASLRRRVRKTFVNAAARKNQPYAGNLPYGIGETLFGCDIIPCKGVFRHCYWSCRMAQEFGADQAEKMTRRLDHLTATLRL